MTEPLLRFLADEDFNNRVLRGLLAQRPDLDIVRVQDTELSGTSDPVVLAWAAREGRILLTHDKSTMINHARSRIKAGAPMPGLCAFEKNTAIKKAIDHFLVMLGASLDGEWENQIRYVPL